MERRTEARDTVKLNAIYTLHGRNTKKMPTTNAYWIPELTNHGVILAEIENPTGEIYGTDIDRMQDGNKHRLN